MNSQVGWCMTKLLRKTAALELFKTVKFPITHLNTTISIVQACTQDPFILNHMDTYARLLTSKTAVPNDSQCVIL